MVTKLDGRGGVVSVRWDNGNYGYYRMGAAGKFELKPAQRPGGIEARKQRSEKVDTEEESLTEEEEEEEDEEEGEEELVSSCDQTVAGATVNEVSCETVLQESGPRCEYCGLVVHTNSLSSTICVACTAKLWRGEIGNKKNEFERYEKVAFINI